MSKKNGHLRSIIQMIIIIALSLASGWVLNASAEPAGNQQAKPEAAPVGSAFTYQGYLEDGGEPADGSYDFRFLLFDTSGGGSQVGPLVSADDVAVVDGIFTVQLDFGDVFDGTAYWLEIEVRDGTSTGAYTTLTPRQPLTPVPYASYASNIPTHDHLNEVWIGSDGLEINVSGGEGLISTSDDVSISAITSHSLKPAATFINTGGGLLLALNDENSATDLEMQVTSAGDMSLSGGLTAGSLSGEGSGVTNVDAETLDGIDSAGFADSVHSHSEYASLDHEHGTGVIVLSGYEFNDDHEYSAIGFGEDSWDRNIGYITINCGGTCYLQHFSAPVTIPQGAEITSVSGYYYDNDPVNNMDFGYSLVELNPAQGTKDTIAGGSLTTSGDVDSVQADTDTIIPSNSIDLTTNAYAVLITMQVDDTSADLRVYGARIEYSMP
jgi:hypothetical protein